MVLLHQNNTIICGGYLIGSYEGDGNWGVYPNHHPDQHDVLFLPSNSDIMFSVLMEVFTERMIVLKILWNGLL